MGQGDYEPGCQYCRHIDTSNEIRRCLLHDIVVPALPGDDADFLCSDWQLTETSDKMLWSWISRLPETYETHLDSLKSGILYYSAGYSQGWPPRPFWGRLDYIKSIKNYMFRAHLWEHKTHGWMIRVGTETNHSTLLPAAGRKCNLSLDDNQFEFKAIRILWKRPKRTLVNQAGASVPVSWRRGTEKIIANLESPNSLREWADHYFDVDEIVKEYGELYDSVGWGISVFLEVIKPRKSYSLRPGLHFHPSYVRDKALLKDD